MYKIEVSEILLAACPLIYRLLYPFMSVPFVFSALVFLILRFLTRQSWPRPRRRRSSPATRTSLWSARSAWRPVAPASDSASGSAAQAWSCSSQSWTSAASRTETPSSCPGIRPWWFRLGGAGKNKSREFICGLEIRIIDCFADLYLVIYYFFLLSFSFWTHNSQFLPSQSKLSYLYVKE